MKVDGIKSVIRDLIKETLFGKRMRVQVGDKLFPALISQNTRDTATHEGKYRLTWFDYSKGKEPQISHIAFSKKDLDYILSNKKLPKNVIIWYIKHSLPIPQLLFEGRKSEEEYIIVGNIDNFGEIETRRGGSHKMLRNRGDQDWRYNELTQRVYWHDKHSIEFERMVEEWLENEGYKVIQHITLDNLKGTPAYNDMWDEAHGVNNDVRPPREYRLSEIKTPASDEFKHWFTGSKVVDQNGNPLVVYHGTDKDFDMFDFNYAGSRDTGYYGAGMYFTPDPLYASHYPLVHSIQTKDHDLIPGKRPSEGKRIIPVYLKIVSPFVIEKGPNQLYSLVKTDKGKDITKKLKKLGYDGVIKWLNGKITEIVAFYPRQIKSVFSMKFNPYDPDIGK